MKVLSLFLVAVAFFAAVSLPQQAAAGNDLSIASFNVQIFGQSVMSDPAEVKVLVEIITRFDLVSILEVRDKSEEAIFELLTAVNEKTSDPFAVTVSERLGRTSSKEQYAIMYRPSKLSLNNAYVYADVGDVFQRQPYIVEFSFNGLNFNVVAIHTQPDNAVVEVDALFDVYNSINGGSSNSIIMGDFNSDCNYVRESDWAKIRLRNDPRFTWLIPDSADTTTGRTDCAYDRIVVTNEVTETYVPDTATVFRFDQVFDLSPELTGKVSDHYPVQMRLYVDF